jgi:hypothetical protein
MDRGTGLLVGLFVIGYIAFEAYGVHTQRHLMEPGYIHAQYAAAEQAMARCGEAGPGAREQFEHNLAVMERRAIGELLESGDYADEAAAAAEVAARAAERRAEVDGLVANAGCEDKQLWTLVKTYEQRARLNLQ